MQANKGLTMMAMAALLSLCGCIGSFVNPQFLQSLGVGETAATNPGEAPAVVIEVDNRTARWVDALLTWRDADNNVQSRSLVVPPGSSIGELVICPVAEMTLGQVGSPDEPGAQVRLGDGEPDDPFVVVEPFGQDLTEDVNYACGDSITFAIQTSGATLSGYRVFAYVRRGGAN